MSVYVFLDAGYIRGLYAKFIEPVYIATSINWEYFSRSLALSAIATLQGHGINPSRTFFYDCFDEEKRNGETEQQFDNRKQAYESERKKIKELGKHHIRSGKLVGKPRRQKQVDVQLAVDMLGNAFAKNYEIALLVAGDQDFVPVVNEVARLGRHVVIAGHPKNCSQELRDASDLFVQLDPYRMVKFNGAEQPKVGVACVNDEQWHRFRRDKGRDEVVNGVKLFQVATNKTWVATNDKNYCWHPDRDLLIRFLEAMEL